MENDYFDKRYIKKWTDFDIEAEHRRGYYDGYITALKNFDTVMNAGFTCDKAYDYCERFWKNELGEWAISELGNNKLPPEIVVEIVIKK